ncbi:hypothetical protein J5N97_013548 [Dioscorea zingiberensis]|uniref:Uncharacterized protein n=1 Tax=Dioscorea zingiberensis TaxID=325984 RepID=A0A9D5CSG1_9LILI|nr:hypothetical protein J5N97_013548 [Dioscorea zingiberensis]
MRIPGEKIRQELTDIDHLSEKLIEDVLQRFLEDLKNEKLDAGGWPMMLPSYSMSKVALNAYTRMLAKRHQGMCINCVRPGHVKTDLNFNTGVMAPEDEPKGSVMLALLPPGGPSGSYFDRLPWLSFEGGLACVHLSCWNVAVKLQILETNRNISDIAAMKSFAFLVMMQLTDGNERSKHTQKIENRNVTNKTLRSFL